MRITTRVALATALLALGACAGADEAGNAGANAAEASGPAPASNAATEAPAAANETANAAEAAPASDGSLSREYLVGRWSETGDCTDTVEFRADGSFTFPWGDTGQWTLEGDRLRMSTNTGDLRLAAVDAGHLDITYPSGRVARQTRC